MEGARTTAPPGAPGGPLAAGAAPARPVGGTADTAPASGPGRAVTGRPETVHAELWGVRVPQAPRWIFQAEGVAAEVLVQNAAADARTLLLVVTVHDAQGERLTSLDAVLWDLAPGETRTVVQPLPSLPTLPAEVRARLEPLVP